MQLHSCPSHSRSTIHPHKHDSTRPSSHLQRLLLTVTGTHSLLLFVLGDRRKSFQFNILLPVPICLSVGLSGPLRSSPRPLSVCLAVCLSAVCLSVCLAVSYSICINHAPWQICQRASRSTCDRRRKETGRRIHFSMDNGCLQRLWLAVARCSCGLCSCGCCVAASPDRSGLDR